jgi:PAS domain S-box-containing protein
MQLQDLPFDLIVERLNDGVLIVGLDGGVIYANPLMLEILGRAWGEVEGRTLFDFMSPEWAERARANLRRRARGIEERFDHQFLHSSGAPIWAMVSTRLLTIEGKEPISLVAIRDITARRQAERELRELKEELEERVAERTRELEHEVGVRREAERLALEESETKSRLLANMSHELRTPLHTIIGYTEMMLEENAGGATAQRRDLELVLSSGRHLLAVIEDVLDISKLEAGEATARPSDFMLGALVDEVGEMLSPVLREGGNAFALEDRLGDDAVRLDRLRLKQIVLNLVSNAARYTTDGRVTVRLTEPSRGRLRIEVEDTGCGIEPAAMYDLFEPFVRVGEDMDSERTGTGLGLAITKRYCEMMGGRIKAESTVGRGSTFTVELPRSLDDTTRGEERAMVRETTTSSDGTTISYRVFGEGPHTIVLVHGWMVSGAVYDPIIGALEGLGARVVVPDLRGAGESEPGASGYAIDRYVEDVAAVLEALGEGPVDMVGHSMGGQIAQVVAARHPARVSRLALVCPVPASGIPLPDDARGLFSTSGGDRDKQGMILGMACLELADADKERMLDDAGGIPADCIEEGFEAWSAGGFQDELGAITATTLVVGTDDPFLPPEFLGAAVVDPIEGATFQHIPGPGHYPQIERTQECADALTAFFGA